VVTLAKRSTENRASAYRLHIRSARWPRATSWEPDQARLAPIVADRSASYADLLVLGPLSRTVSGVR
jgi:hypothetical protein